jgi:O-acetylserine/cysteine efflux transporter
MNFGQALLALIVPITWGFGFTLAKIGMEQFSPLFLMSMRFGIAGLILVWFTKPPWGHMRQIFLIAVVGSTLQYGLTYNGLRGLDASTAAILVELEAPILALFGAIFLKERFGLSKVFGMLLAFVGVIVIVGEPRLDGNIDSVTLLLVGASVWAAAQIMVSKLKSISGFTILAWVAVMATPQMLVASLVFEQGQWQSVVNADMYDWSIVAYLGVVMTILGYSVWYHLLRVCKVSTVSPFLMLLPVTSIIAGIVLLDEVFTLPMAIGGALVLVGVAATTIDWVWVRSKFQRTYH